MADRPIASTPSGPQGHSDAVSRGYPILGAELEMAVIDQLGQSACVGDHYFETLAALKAEHGPVTTERAAGRTVAITSADGVNGIDNAFNLLESALAPEPAGPTTLRRLAHRMHSDLASVLAALAPSDTDTDLTITSLAQHPTVGFGQSWYRRVRAPKSVYTYLVEDRGWTHAIGVDAKAQNGPTTAVDTTAAIDVLNMLLAASPAFIALFANSPYECGRLSGVKETRMTLWPRMVATSRVAADPSRVGLPPRPFRSIADYFQWMFEDSTVMHAVPAETGNYKGSGALFVVGDGQVNTRQFFKGDNWNARRVGGTEDGRIQPTPNHFTFLQWSNFLDFRLRFSFGPDGPTLRSLRHAFDNDFGFNEIFASYANNLYLENRCAGATFVDNDLAEQAPDAVLASCMISPSALQAGLAAAAPAVAASFLDTWRWPVIQELREAAIRDALNGGNSAVIRRFAAHVIDIADSHLPPDDRWALAYPKWVLETGRTGADRAIAEADRRGLSGIEGLQHLARRRAVRLPPRPPPSQPYGVNSGAAFAGKGD